MKITSRPETPQVSSPTSGAPSAKGTAATTGTGESEPAAKAALSSDASFIQALRDEAAGLDRVRPEVVAETRAQLEAGTLGQDVDMEDMVDALLAEL